jgi:hypothetical protein
MLFGGRLEICDLCDLAGNLSVHQAMQHFYCASVIIFHHGPLPPPPFYLFPFSILPTPTFSSIK